MSSLVKIRKTAVLFWYRKVYNTFPYHCKNRLKLSSKAIFLLSVLFLSGCATYKFHHGKAPYDKGYVVSRDNYTIPEYTLGKDNLVPPLKVARERFQRRRKIVEDYYKRMGFIENHFRMAFCDPAVTLLKLVGGIVRLPFIAVSDYRYEHNPKYKERIKKIEAEQDNREANRIASLKEKLNEYLIKDLSKEPPVAEEVSIPQALTEQLAASPATEQLAANKEEEKAVVAEEPAYPAETKPLAQEVTAPAPKKEEKPVIIKEKAKKQKPLKKEKPVLMVQESIKHFPIPLRKSLKVIAKGDFLEGDLKAAITAKPLKGYSPLKVQFDGRKSSSPYGKIISYNWEFGDGDISTKPNPINTYWSTTFGSRYFTATLTVKDDKGNTANSSVEIEAMTK